MPSQKVVVDDALLKRIASEVAQLSVRGEVAAYIPELAAVPKHRFGIAVCTVSGDVAAFGDADIRFSIQSISKVFSLALALQLLRNEFWQRAGREASATSFNALTYLEQEKGVPRNPFINSGALVVTDVLVSRYVQPEAAVAQLLRRLSGDASVDYNLAVAHSEIATADRNRAIAYLIKSLGNLHGSVEAVIDAYCKQCAIEMSCISLARAAATIAGRGTPPGGSENILDGEVCKQVTALMATCGTYNESGDFAFRVGIPAKSGVGGGIVGVIPGEMGICMWSPGLSESGNSVVASKALELFAKYSGRSVF